MKVVVKAKAPAGIKDLRKGNRDIKAFVDSLNAQMKKSKSPGRVDLGKDIRYIDPPRIRTGVLGLDIITGGGIPRGHRTQYWGPWSTAKTTTAGLTVGQAQAAGLGVAWAAVEGWSKGWMRRLGVLIPYSDDELLRLKKVKPKMAARVEREQGDWPAFAMLQHPHGDAILEMLYHAIKSNVFGVVCLDSIGAIKRYADIEERSIEDQKYGGEASLFGALCGKVYSALNVKYNPETNEPYETVKDGWEGNSTAVLLINQARQKIGGYNPTGQTQYKPVGGESLGHFWDLSVQFKPGPRFADKIGDVKDPWGVEVRAKVDKSKVCAPERETEWTLYTAKHGNHKAGSVDLAKQVFAWGDFYGLFEKKGAWYTIQGERFNGKDPAIEHLQGNGEACKKLYDEILDAAKKASDS